MANSYITVSELNYYLFRLLDSDSLIKGMRLMGEVSGVSVRDNNIYFTVKDNEAQISALQFGGAYIPKNGEKVILTGTPEFYQKGGRLSFRVYKIEPLGLGEIHIELERRKRLLMEEGLFEPKFKKEIPKYPKNVCVVTSVKGAVIKDIVSTIRKYNKSIDITAIDVKVQGQNAEKSMIKGLLAADSLGFDVIILARGGGSFEDLLPFNDETLARVIFSLDTPIISAVGHETDFSISDFVADVRALTPTAAAEIVSFDEDELKNSIKQELTKISSALNHKIEALLNISALKTQNMSFIMQNRLNELLCGITNTLNYTENKINQKISENERSVNDYLSKLSLLNPASIMQKGYFKVAKEQKNIVSVNELEVGDEFKLYSFEGSLSAIVTKK